MSPFVLPRVSTATLCRDEAPVRATRKRAKHQCRWPRGHEAWHHGRLTNWTKPLLWNRPDSVLHFCSHGIWKRAGRPKAAIIPSFERVIITPGTNRTYRYSHLKLFFQTSKHGIAPLQWVRRVSRPFGVQHGCPRQWKPRVSALASLGGSMQSGKRPTTGLLVRQSPAICRPLLHIERLGRLHTATPLYAVPLGPRLSPGPVIEPNSSQTSAPRGSPVSETIFPKGSISP